LGKKTLKKKKKRSFAQKKGILSGGVIESQKRKIINPERGGVTGMGRKEKKTPPRKRLKASSGAKKGFPSTNRRRKRKKRKRKNEEGGTDTHKKVEFFSQSSLRSSFDKVTTWGDNIKGKNHFFPGDGAARAGKTFSFREKVFAKGKAKQIFWSTSRPGENSRPARGGACTVLGGAKGVGGNVCP